MPSEEFMKKARELLHQHKQSIIAAETVRDRQAIDLRVLIATALESADASGYARGRAEALEECATVAETWKSSYHPGSDQRLSGHHEARREIAAAIRRLSQKDTRHAD